MAIRIANLNKTDRFVPDSDPDKGTPNETVFHLRTLDSYDVAHIQEQLQAVSLPQMTGDKDLDDAAIEQALANSNPKMFSSAIVATQLALTETENLQIEDAEAAEGFRVVPFEATKQKINGKTRLLAAPHIINAIPLPVHMSIYVRVMQMSQPSKAEEKNSD